MSKGILTLMKEIRRDREKILGRKLHPLFLTKEYRKAEAAHKKRQYEIEQQKQKKANDESSELATSRVEPLIKL